MKKKLVFGVLLVGLMLVLSVSVSGAEIKEVNIDQAIQLALKHNIDLRIASVNLANARIAYKKSQAGNILTESRQIELESELNLDRAEENYRKTRNQVIMGIISDYLKIMQSKQNIQIKGKQLELEKNNLTEVKTQVETGHKGKLDQLKQENSFNNARFEVNKAEDDFRQSKREFKIKLGLNEEENIQLRSIEDPEIWEINEEQALEAAFNNDLDLKLKKQELNLYKVQLEKAEAISTPELEYKELKNNLQLAKLKIEREKKELGNSVRRKYYKYTRAVKKLELGQRNSEEARENYRIIKEQQEAGLKTTNNVLAAKISYLQADHTYKSHISNYYLSLLELQQVMGMEIGGQLNEFSKNK